MYKILVKLLLLVFLTSCNDSTKCLAELQVWEMVTYNGKVVDIESEADGFSARLEDGPSNIDLNFEESFMKEQLWDQLQIGDSLYTEKGSLEFIIKRPGKEVNVVLLKCPDESGE
jgi:hypothetical protein